MDFTLAPAVRAYREQVRSIIAAHHTATTEHHHHETGTFNNQELNRALAAAGLIERAVPGLGAGDPIELWVLFNEMEKAGVPLDALAMAVMIAGVVHHVGTPFQKAVVIPAVTSGDALICLGYSEPDAGSDLAALSTRAVRDGNEWVINGAKMWTTMAHEARWVILLARTDASLPRHQGLTMFLVPMDTPGIRVDPVATMATERTNATFYDDVRVGDECVLGEVNGGWQVMGVALSFERGVMGGTNPGVPLLRHTMQWALESRRLAEPAVREKLARVAIDNHVAALLTQRAAWIASSGGLPGLEGSMTKLFASEAYQKASRWFQEMAGAEGLLQMQQPGAVAHGWIEYDARHSPVTTIYGGTSEMIRNDIAERHLGLPRVRR
jgi:alkylation response protein AidB-like acyl-CoA dehydrogenase